MKGVSKVKGRNNCWRVRYGRSVDRYFDNEKDAIAFRKACEKEAPLKVKHPKSNYINKRFKIIGDTGKRHNGAVVYVVKDLKANEYFESILPNLRANNPRTGRGARTQNVHANISKQDNGFLFKKIVNGQITEKYCSALSAALAYRNQWLTDHNLPIPD